MRTQPIKQQMISHTKKSLNIIYIITHLELPKQNNDMAKVLICPSSL